MQRILVIRGGAVGDMIVTLPALRALRRAFPRATIELLGNPSRAILAQHPYYVDRITDLERWDLYRLFNQSPTVSEALATFLSTCELILSYVPVPDEIFPTNLRHYCQGEVLTWQPHPPAGVHITDHLLQPVTRFLRQPCDACPHVYPDPTAQEVAARFWHTAGLPDQGVVAFHPGSGGAYKLWPLLGWQQVMAWAAQRRIPGLIISGPAEQAHDAHLSHPAHFPSWPRAQNLPLIPSRSSAGTLSSDDRARLGYHPSRCRCWYDYLGPLWPDRSPGLGATQPPGMCALPRSSRAFDARESSAPHGHADPHIPAARDIGLEKTWRLCRQRSMPRSCGTRFMPSSMVPIRPWGRRRNAQGNVIAIR